MGKSLFLWICISISLILWYTYLVSEVLKMKALSITSRTITLELENNLPFYAEQEFEIYINGNLYKKERRNVFTIFNLSPNTSYTIQVEKREKK